MANKGPGTPRPEETEHITNEEERVCGHCIAWHKPACSYPGADPFCIVPTNRYAADCRNYTQKEADKTQLTDKPESAEAEEFSTLQEDPFAFKNAAKEYRKYQRW